VWVAAQGASGERELVLPTGAMHLVFRVSGAPLRLFDRVDDAVGRVVGHAVVGGARDSFYVRDVSTPSCTVGAQFHAGAAPLLLGAPADELAGRHTVLGDLWGADAERARARLIEADGPERKLELLEAMLADRLPRVRGLHPAVAMALSRFAHDGGVREVVARSGYSHRRFIALFRGAVGITPKTYTRVLRFQRVLARLARAPSSAWVDVALDAGYSDQSHFNREFRELAGVSPGEYRRAAPAAAHHVAIARRG
jgi:AraC-like DNA-binding protein